MRRREFISLLGGAAAAWRSTARAQQPARRIGILLTQASDDAEQQVSTAAFLQGLQEAGWSVGRNLRIETRWGAGDNNRFRTFAAELVALAPDVIFVSGSGPVAALQQVTQTVPVVFSGVVDPVGAGYVASLARPGGNVTGFTVFEYAMSGKWLELLREIAPRVTRAAVLREVDVAAGIGQFGAVQSVAPLFGVELIAIGLRDAAEIERGLAAFARGSNGGLIVTGSGSAIIHRDLIVALAARHRLPAVYFRRAFVASGGLHHRNDADDPCAMGKGLGRGLL